MVGIARALLVEVLGVKRSGGQLDVIRLLTLGILVEVEDMATGTFALHISGDNVQIVQIHRGIVLEGDLLFGCTAGVGTLARIGSRRVVGSAALGAINNIVSGIRTIGQFGEGVIDENL